MSLSEVLSGVLQPLFDLVPQIHPRPASTEFGVVDDLWGKPRQFRGPRAYVPALTHIQVFPAVEIPIDTGLQTLTSFDGKSVAINATTILTITDPVALRTAGGDEWEELVSMKIRGLVCETITSHKWSQSLRQAADFIEADCYDDLWHVGIDVKRVVLEDMSETIPLRIFQ